EGSTVRPLLKQIGANLLQLRSSLNQSLENLPHLGKTTGEIRISDNLNRILNITDKLAQDRKDKFISSELFLLALLDDDNDPAAKALKAAHVTKAKLEQAIHTIRGGETVQDENAEDQRQ